MTTVSPGLDHCKMGHENHKGFGFVNRDNNESINSDEADGELDQPKKSSNRSLLQSLHSLQGFWTVNLES
ncbi:hypothetical protein PtA15_2A234 [Puccinia triticina]|uniref:CSD domain-containing protein n=1 Tax=Puccinia triticina TaxID=208348 RepID=A0ABY7C9R1_9BASI|nr:uncharacterized protein PtA15_2A234 [Puccinia triticina]WAQ81921.1 hypothetical protein PtA15_2A234 [Puccinia triticina]